LNKFSATINDESWMDVERWDVWEIFVWHRVYVLTVRHPVDKLLKVRQGVRRRDPQYPKSLVGPVFPRNESTVKIYLRYRRKNLL
jgi:hypothetical protein